MLASPEAAQAHLEEWKKTLEQAAQGVRQRMIEQLQSEEQRATRESRERFEATTTDSAARLSEKLSEVSQATLANTGNLITDRTSALRMLLNEMISQAETSMRSLGVGLQQERAKAEQAKTELEGSAKSATEDTQQRISQFLAEQQRSIAGQADALIAERIQSIDPLLRNAAQNVMERFSGEVERKVAAKVEEAHQTISGITAAAARAAEVQARLNQQIQEAAGQSAQIQDSIQARIQQVSEASVQKAASELNVVQQAIAGLQDELRQRAQQLSNDLAQTRNGAVEYVQQGANEAVRAALGNLAAARQDAERLQESIRSEIEQASAQLALVQNTTREKVQRESDAAVQKAVAELAFAGQEIVLLQDSVRAQKQVVTELVEEAERAVRAKLQQATSETLQSAVSELQNSTAQARQLQSSLREQGQQAEAQFAEVQARVRQQVRQAAEQQARESIESARQEAAKLPLDLETACRATIARMEEELDQKSSEMQHSAYEALLKTSEWYQKKAQSSMQSTMERVIEQSSNTMKEKAAEISNMVAGGARSLPPKLSRTWTAWNSRKPPRSRWHANASGERSRGNRQRHIYRSDAAHPA